MIKRDFLEKPYDYMNDIVLFLYNNNGRTTKSRLVQEFQISLPTLNEYLTFLKDFIKEHELDKKMRIFINGEQIEIEKQQLFPLKQLMLLFLEKSIKFQMVKQLFARGELSCDFFQLTYAISSATYYRKITELNELLKEFQLQIKRGKLIGEEKQIRYFFFNFYWFLFENKEAFTKEIANQYLGFVDQLQQTLDITLEPAEILQVKLWMKISFKRMTTEPAPAIGQNYDKLERPLFEDIHTAFVTYMKKVERPYTLYEAYMFYDFFCAMNNFSPHSAFAYRLAEAHRKEKTYLNYMNHVILKYLKERGYTSIFSSPTRLSYIENYLFQFHSQIYYFDGFILPFDTWTIHSIVTIHKHPFAGNEVQEIMTLASQKFDRSDKPSTSYHHQLAEIHYTIILNHVAALNENKIVIGVYHSLNPFICQLVIQSITNLLSHKYPIKVEAFSEDNHYDLLLSNTQHPSFSNTPESTYIFSGIGNNYDIDEVEKLIIKLISLK